MSPEDRFWAKVDKSGECWEWTGGAGPSGYGRFGRTVAHRYAFELVKRPLAPGETVDHLCRNRRCVNPDHLDGCSRAENSRRANLRKPREPRGDLLTDGDLIGSAETCELAQIDRATLSRHVALGKITPAMRLPGKAGALLFDRKAVAIYIATIKPERVA